jgi:hypothetical protein
LIYKLRVWGGKGEDIVASGKGKGGKAGEEGQGKMGEGSVDFATSEDNLASIYTIAPTLMVNPIVEHVFLFLLCF